MQKRQMIIFTKILIRQWYIIKHYKSHYFVYHVILNAKVGDERDDVSGGFWLDERNALGEKLIEWTRAHNMNFGNTSYDYRHGDLQ